MNPAIPKELGETQAFVPGFQEDVFVSYGHFDNDSPKQWVSKLHTRLKAELEVVLGEPVRFWRDEKLAGADILDTSLRKTIGASALFLPILSPRYVNNTCYCGKELEWFVEEAQRTGGLIVDTKSRIVPVVKLPPPDLPPAISQLNPVFTNFFKIDRGRAFTHAADEGLPGYLEFYQTCQSLARDLSRVLLALKSKHQGAPPTSKGKTIFVASVSSDRRTARTSVVNFLRERGYTVSGQGQAPESKSELLEWLREELSHASMAIHLVGRGYGAIPEQEHGEKKSTVWLQYEEARKSGKRQLVWVPADLGETGEEQKQFLAALETVGDAQTEVLRGGFAEFSESLPDELAKLEPQKTARDRGVYLICERGDLPQEQLKAIRAFLADHGIPVVQPAFQGDPSLLRELESESVAGHDATVIYYGSAPDAWVLLKRRAILSALEKIGPGQAPARVLYLGEPPDDVKLNVYLDYSGKQMPDERARFGPLWVLGDCAQFHPDKLKPLLEVLERERP